MTRSNKRRKKNKGSSNEPTEDYFHSESGADANSVAYTKSLATNALLPAMAERATRREDATNDDDSDSDVEFILPPSRSRHSNRANQSTKAETIVTDPTKHKSHLDVEGVVAPSIDGFVYQAIFHTRYISEPEQSYKTVVLKNVIIAFQGLVLFEDCLVHDAFGKNLYKFKPRVLSALQAALGFPIRHPEDKTIINVIAGEYKRGRVRHVLKRLDAGKEPEKPTNRMEALLVELIDRCLMFECSKSPVRSSKESTGGWKRVKVRENTLRTTVASAAGIESLLTVFAAMVPPDMRSDTSKRTWEIASWVTAQKKLYAEEKADKIDFGDLMEFKDIDTFFALAFPNPKRKRMTDDD